MENVTMAGAVPAVGVGITCRLGNWQGKARDERTKEWVNVPAMIEGARVSQATTASGCYVRWQGHEFFVPEWSILKRG